MKNWLKENWFNLARNTILWICFCLFVWAVYSRLTGRLPPECQPLKWDNDLNTCDFGL